MIYAWLTGSIFNFKVVRGVSDCRDIVICLQLGTMPTCEEAARFTFIPKEYLSNDHFTALPLDPALPQRDLSCPPPLQEGSSSIRFVGRKVSDRGKSPGCTEMLCVRDEVS